MSHVVVLPLCFFYRQVARDEEDRPKDEAKSVDSAKQAKKPLRVMQKSSIEVGDKKNKRKIEGISQFTVLFAPSQKRCVELLISAGFQFDESIVFGT